MGSAALTRMMERKPPRKFADGPPEDPTRGGAEGGDLPGDEGPPSDVVDAGGAAEPGGFGEHVEMAIDDLADIAGVSPEDRKDFGTALQAVIHACIADARKDEAVVDDEEPPVEEEDPTAEE